MKATREPRPGLHTTLRQMRDKTTGNNFLGNGDTELNTTSQVYDLQFRNYDPILGRMHQVDPLAHSFGSLTPYNYSFNNPVAFYDVNGAKPGPWSADRELHGGRLWLSKCMVKNGSQPLLAIATSFDRGLAAK